MTESCARRNLDEIVALTEVIYCSTIMLPFSASEEAA